MSPKIALITTVPGQESAFRPAHTCRLRAPDVPLLRWTTDQVSPPILRHHASVPSLRELRSAVDPTRSRRRRMVAWVAAVVALGTVYAGLVTVNGGWQRMEDLAVACQHVFEENKHEFKGYHWGWTSPGWVCEFHGRPCRPRDGPACEEGKPHERRLPFGRRD